MKKWLASEGRYVEGGQGGRPGDLVFFDGNHDGTLDHIGFVESIGTDGTVHTIEGNSSDAVSRRARRPDEIAGYGSLP
jgi:predicted Holliday junction resolvase-like endonuclease